MGVDLTEMEMQAIVGALSNYVQSKDLPNYLLVEGESARFKIKDILKKKVKEENMMKLSDTVDGMNGADYKKRFIAEYQQLVIRYRGLDNMLRKWDKGELNFKPTCPRSTYNMQIKAMTDYIAVLEARAVMEGIDLDTSANAE